MGWKRTNLTWGWSSNSKLYKFYLIKNTLPILAVTSWWFLSEVIDSVVIVGVVDNINDELQFVSDIRSEI